MQEDNHSRNISARRLERARAFQVLYALFFTPPADARALAATYQRSLYAAPASGGEVLSELFDNSPADGSSDPNAAKMPGLPDIHSLHTSDEDVLTPASGTSSAKPEGFGWELTAGAWGKREELDKHITSFSQNWKIERVGKVELALLRLALFELLFRDDVPPKVVLNEAIELSRQFGDENSRSFVNGILDAAVRAVESGTLKRESYFWSEEK